MKRPFFCLMFVVIVFLSVASCTYAQPGCKNAAGRPRERICETPLGYVACVALLKKGDVDFCAWPGDPNGRIKRTTPESAESELLASGCKKGKGNIYECPKTPLCISYKNFFGLMGPKPSPIAMCQVPVTPGCQNAAGRPRERICQTKEGYDACAAYVKAGEMDFCAWSGDPTARIRRATPQSAAISLIGSGCKKLGKAYSGIWRCNNPQLCNAYKNFFELTDKKSSSISSCEVESSNEGILIVYGADASGKFGWTSRTMGSWNGWETISDAGGVAGAPDACSPTAGRVVVMYRSGDESLRAGLFDLSSGKYSFTNYLSLVGSDPSVVCQPDGTVNMFVRAHNNPELYFNYSIKGVWNGLYDVPNGNGLAIEDVAAKAGEPAKSSFWDFIAGPEFTEANVMLSAMGLGGALRGSPDGSLMVNSRRAVFVRGTDDYVWWRQTTTSNSWSEWASLGGIKVTSDPSAVMVQRNEGGILLFARGEDNKLYARQFNPTKGQKLGEVIIGQWTPWILWGGSSLLAGAPEAVSWRGNNQVDVFYRGFDGSLNHLWRDQADITAANFYKEPYKEVVPSAKISGDPAAVALEK